MHTFSYNLDQEHWHEGSSNHLLILKHCS